MNISLYLFCFQSIHRQFIGIFNDHILIYLLQHHIHPNDPRSISVHVLSNQKKIDSITWYHTITNYSIQWLLHGFNKIYLNWIDEQKIFLRKRVDNYGFKKIKFIVFTTRFERWYSESISINSPLSFCVVSDNSTHVLTLFNQMFG